jgi:hypothetical protein
MRRGLLVPVLLLVLGGCIRAAPGCTAVGGVSGVTFVLDALVTEPGFFTIRACADGHCESFEDRPAAVFVELVDVSQPKVVAVTLTVTQSGSVFDAATDVELRKFEPNGPRCGPTVYVGLVRATASGTLEPG